MANSRNLVSTIGAKSGTEPGIRKGKRSLVKRNLSANQEVDFCRVPKGVHTSYIGVTSRQRAYSSLPVIFRSCICFTC